MAQPVEQLIRNQQVTSSNLVSSSKFFKLKAPLKKGAFNLSFAPTEQSEPLASSPTLVRFALQNSRALSPSGEQR